MIAMVMRQRLFKPKKVPPETLSPGGHGNAQQPAEKEKLALLHTKFRWHPKMRSKFLTTRGKPAVAGQQVWLPSRKNLTQKGECGKEISNTRRANLCI